MGKSTISMTIFNSFLLVDQRVPDQRGLRQPTIGFDDIIEVAHNAHLWPDGLSSNMSKNRKWSHVLGWKHELTNRCFCIFLWTSWSDHPDTTSTLEKFSGHFRAGRHILAMTWELERKQCFGSGLWLFKCRWAHVSGIESNNPVVTCCNWVITTWEASCRMLEMEYPQFYIWVTHTHKRIIPYNYIYICMYIYSTYVSSSSYKGRMQYGHPPSWMRFLINL